MKIMFIGLLIFGLGMTGCTSSPKLDVRVHKNDFSRQPSSASTSKSKFSRKPAWIWGSKSSANVLVCQLPGSNMSFSFSFVDNTISDKNGYVQGVTGLAYSTNEISDGTYDFNKDKYRIIGTNMDGFLHGPKIDDGYSQKGKAVVGFENNFLSNEEGTIVKGLFVEGVHVNFDHTGKKPVFTSLTADLYHNKMANQYEVALGKNDFDYVRQTVTFKPEDCRGDLDSLWNNR